MKLGKYITMSDKLTGEYKKVFEDIDSYGDTHLVSGSYKNEKMMDLLDILLTSQEQETDVKRIVGTDLEQFSKDFFSDMTIVDLMEPFFSKLCFWAWLICVLEVIVVFSMRNSENFNIFTVKTDFSGYAEGFMIAYAGVMIADLISIVLTKLKCYTQKIYVIMVAGFTILALGIAFLMGMKGYSLQVTTSRVIAIAIAYLIIYYCAKMFYRYVKTGSIIKRKNEYDTTFTGIMKEEVGQIDYSDNPRVLKSYSRQYKKKNKKREKKGLKLLTTKEFLIKQEFETKCMGFAGFTVGALAAFTGTLFLYGFESLSDEVTFIVILIGIYVLAYLVLIRSVDKIAKAGRANVLKQCEESGVEIDELYERYVELKKEKLTE